MLFTMKSLAALALLAVALPLVAQQQPVPYSITCYTPQNCTATPRPGVTVVQDNRPKLSDALATLQQQLAQQAQLRAQQEQARAASVNAKAISDANDKLMADIEKILDSSKPKPQPIAAQGDMLSGGWANGRMWAAMDETNRLIYLLAVCEGTWRTEGGPERCKGTNRITMMNWIGDFYSHGPVSRELVPVSSVQWFYVHEKSPQEIATYVRDYLAGQLAAAGEGNSH